MRYPKDRRVGTGYIRFCSSCGQWQPRATNFYRVAEHRVTRGFAFPRRCKTCVKIAKTPDGGNVPVGRIQPIVNGMIEQVGFRATATRIGVSRATLSYWLHLLTPHHGKPAKTVQKAQAVKVVAARLALNKELTGGKTFDIRPAAQRKSRKRTGRCVRCGTDSENYTDGCETCWERRTARAARAA